MDLYIRPRLLAHRECVHAQDPTPKLKRSDLHDGGGGGDCILQSRSFTRLGNPVLLTNRFSTSRLKNFQTPTIFASL